MARIAGKLTAKALGWDRATISATVKGLPADGRKMIARIVGIVNGTHETVNEETGELQVGLKGQFRGISTLNEFVQKRDAKGAVITDKDGVVQMEDTGKPIVLTAGRGYLPGGIQDMIEGAYRQAIEGDAKATISFSVDLYVKPDSNKAGYSYDADTINQPVEADPLAALLDAAEATKASGIALPAPEAAAEPAKAE